MQIHARRYQRLLAAAAWEHVASGNYSGPAYGMYAHLVTAISGTVNDQTLWAAVTEATYGGYAPQAQVLPAATIDGPSGPQGVCDMLTWAATDAVTPENIVGIVYTDNAVHGNILGIDLLATPVPMADANSGFSSVTILDLPWETDGVPAVVVQ